MRSPAFWRLDLDPVILHEQPNAGATIIEKLEAHGGCDFAVVVLTPDDEGRLVGDERLRARARQNVIYELGYFVGRLNRKRVAALVAPGLEMPSDFHGVVFIPIDVNDAWQMLLGRELKKRRSTDRHEQGCCALRSRHVRSSHVRRQGADLAGDRKSVV